MIKSWRSRIDRTAFTFGVAQMLRGYVIPGISVETQACPTLGDRCLSGAAVADFMARRVRVGANCYMLTI